MNQINGGGAGVVDFDRDGWPDVYFSQGSKDPQDRDQTDQLDRLYRNLGQQRAFRRRDGRRPTWSKTPSARASPWETSITTGFPTSTWATSAPIGCSSTTAVDVQRRFRKVGDHQESQWTTSCVIADVNGDSLPDIYAVGYLEGDALTRICNDQKNTYACVPFGFPAARHRLWLNQGDGRFEDATVAAQIDRFYNRGTSVIVADVDGSRKLDLLVGNSGTQNYLFKNAVMKRGDPPKFTENSLSLGLAFAADGAPRKCLGLAAGDFNGDGLLDLHGTSVTEESDTLYLQQKGGIFLDKSFAAGLYAPTYNSTSFGTQAIDADLDGKLDLIASGGNFDNMRNEYVEYEMLPTYLTNDGEGHFAPVPAETLGPYFKQKQLGRSVARLDWNHMTAWKTWSFAMRTLPRPC